MIIDALKSLDNTIDGAAVYRIPLSPQKLETRAWRGFCRSKLPFDFFIHCFTFALCNKVTQKYIHAEI